MPETFLFIGMMVVVTLAAETSVRVAGLGSFGLCDLFVKSSLSRLLLSSTLMVHLSKLMACLIEVQGSQPRLTATLDGCTTSSKVNLDLEPRPITTPHDFCRVFAACHDGLFISLHHQHNTCCDRYTEFEDDRLLATSRLTRSSVTKSSVSLSRLCRANRQCYQLTPKVQLANHASPESGSSLGASIILTRITFACSLLCFADRGVACSTRLVIANRSFG